MNGPWQVLAPADTKFIALPVLDSRRRKAIEMCLRSLPSATPVALLHAGPFARRKLRRFAASAAVRVEREYVAFPSLERALFLVEDAPDPVRYFRTKLLTAPPSTGMRSAIYAVVIAVARAAMPWRAMGWITPGRVLLGRRV